MRKNTILRKVIWVLTFALMLIIFILSSRSVEMSRVDSARAMKILGLVDEVEDALDLSDAPMLVIHNALRKYAHEVTFAMLGMLYFLSFYRLGRIKKTAGFAMLLSVVYGASDEFHQIFTRRGAMVSDVFRDALGAFVGISFLVIFFLLVERHEGFKKFINIFYDLELSDAKNNGGCGN